MNNKAPESMLGIVPHRKVFKIKEYEDYNSICTINTKNNLMDFNSEALKISESVVKSENDETNFCYVVHEKMDGIVQSKILFNQIKNNSICNDNAEIISEPQVNEYEPWGYLDKNALKKTASEKGYITKKSIPVWKSLLSVIAGFATVIGTFMKFFDFAAMFDSDADIENKVGGLGVLPEVVLIICGIIFLGTVVLVIRQWKNNQEDSLKQLKEKLKSFEETEFLEFLNSFQPKDYKLPLNFQTKHFKKVFFCPLQKYNTVQKNILLNYWKNMPSGELWWIFTEYVDANEIYIIDDNKDCQRRFYNMFPLSKREKLAIAQTTYSGKCRFEPKHDAGIIKHGVDYLFRFVLKGQGVEINEAGLKQKIAEFENQYGQHSYHIELIAQLHTKYEVDFSCARNWQHLFDNKHSLASLDAALTDKLLDENKLNTSIIPKIVEWFSEDFDEITTLHSENNEITAQTQWCLVKALSCRGAVNETRCFAIADTLLEEFVKSIDYPEDLRTSEWLEIFEAALKYLYEAKIYWFLPTLIRNLINLYHKQDRNTLVFSRPVILEVSRANLILNLRTEDNSKSDMISNDEVTDNFNVVTRAVKELYPDFDLDDNCDLPISFGLLRLTNQERIQYYNALVKLGEKEILEYFDFLFDVFVCSVKYTTYYVPMFYTEEFKNINIYGKYIKEEYPEDKYGKLSSKKYIIAVIRKYLERLNKFYGENNAILNDITKKLLTIIKIDNNEINQQFLWVQIARSEVLGVSTIGFICCIFAKYHSLAVASKNHLNNIYLNFESYLLSLVYSVYHNCNSNVLTDNQIPARMVNNLTQYIQPYDYILGLLFQFDAYAMFDNARRILTDYISAHNDMFLKHWDTVTQNAPDVDTVEIIIGKISSSSALTGELKTSIYENLRQKVAKDFPETNKRSVCLEYLTLKIDGVPTKEFDGDTAENNIQKMQDSGNDICYLLYSYGWMIYCKDKYFELLPKVVKPITESNYKYRYWCVIDYILNSNNKYSDDYMNTVKLLYEHTNKSESYRSDMLKRFLDFAKFLKKEKVENSQHYQWITQEEIENLQIKFESDLNIQIVRQAKEFMPRSAYNQLGLAICLKYLINTVGSKSSPDGYYDLSDDEKLDYIVSNFDNMQPLEGRYINTAYLDMLDAFIRNKRELQNKWNKREFYIKLAQDAPYIIEKLKSISEETKTELKNLFESYTKIILSR